MEDTYRYKITQLSDNGINITLFLIEDIELEFVSQQQLMLEAIDRSISDDEVKKQIKPFLNLFCNPSLKLLSRLIQRQ